MGPVLQYGSGNINKEAYDPRIVVRNPVLQPQPQVIPSAYCYHGNGTLKQEKSVMENERNLSSQARQMPQCGMAAKIAPDISINIDGNPFYMTRAAGTNVDQVDDRITIDRNLMQAKAQFSGIGVAAAASAAPSRKIGAVQFGGSRMY